MVRWLYGLGSRLRAALGLDAVPNDDQMTYYVRDPLETSTADAAEVARDAGPYDFEADPGFPTDHVQIKEPDQA